MALELAAQPSLPIARIVGMTARRKKLAIPIERAARAVDVTPRLGARRSEQRRKISVVEHVVIEHLGALVERARPLEIGHRLVITLERRQRRRPIPVMLRVLRLARDFLARRLYRRLELAGVVEHRRARLSVLMS